MHRMTFSLLLLAVLAWGQSTPAVKPVNAKRTSPASAEQMFVEYCAACHGKDGRGVGPAALALKQAPTDLTHLSKMNSGKYPALRVNSAIIGDANVQAHGSKDMPVWGTVFRQMGSESEAHMRTANLVAYIEKMQR
jgi:mono/diheme cytochrome c family protein